MTLQELAETWIKSGEKARADGHETTATALIGCGQALLDSLGEKDG